MAELLTGHCHLKGHMFKLGLVNSPEHESCKQAPETASDFLYDCVALATLRFRHLSCCFMKPATWRTSLLGKYCTLFNAQSCRMRVS